VWRWRARRALKPFLRELEAEAAQVNRGSEEWRRWWQATGERELRCILMTAWDPIGASDVAEGWDEYNEYAPGIAHRLRDAANADEAAERVADYLDHVERDFMETLTPEGQRKNRYLADSLVAWHEWSFEWGGQQPREWRNED
jgi:hypothetical protein